jgi:tRNA-specific 2-thiouridylase
VFNFGDDFDEHVVGPYVAAHRRGVTPNPCITCNRAIKFARLADRADQLGFDALATGHHARIARDPSGTYTLRRAADHHKDQSYVVHMLDQRRLARTVFPIGDMQKSTVRAIATDLDLRTADKPDSQDVCFITSTGGRASFLAERLPLTRAAVVDARGRRVGDVAAVELVTVGQRRGIGLVGGGPKRYVTHVDVDAPIVVVGDDEELRRGRVVVDNVTWVDGPVLDAPVLVQASAHGAARAAVVTAGARHREVVVRWTQPQRRVAPGQSVVVYDATDIYVLGGGVAR